MQKQVLEILEKVILEKYNIEKKDLKLEIPPKKELGDFAFWGFQLAKDLRKWPNIIVEELKGFLEGQKSDLIESVSVAWPYLNIKVSKNIFTQQFLDYIESGVRLQSYPTNKIEWKKTQNNTVWLPSYPTSNKTIYIDYIWANVWKPLHIGHMCTPNQGQVMINVYRKLWYTVISDSHIWDWGIIFGKLILAYKNWWDESKLKENAVEHLLGLYIKITVEVEKDDNLETQIREEFKKLASWDKESIKLWESFTKESIEAMNVLLGRMNIKPDYNIGESFYEGLGLPKMEDYPDLKYSMKEVVEELLEKKIASVTKNDDGTQSIWVNFADELKLSGCILQKKDGTHGYLASDLASIKYRKDNWDLEKIIYFVDSRQQLHLRQVFEIAKQAGWLGETQLFHAYNWFISLKDWAMSTRTWKIIKLEKLLDEAESRAEKIILEKRDDIEWEELKKLSKTIWIWAIKYWYLKKNRESDIIFDWDEFMSFEGNSGPYIQYAYVRARRILEKENYVGYDCNRTLQEAIFNSNSEIELAKKIMQFNSILKESIENNYPHIITSYAYSLTKAFSSFYNNVRVKETTGKDLKQLQLLLVDSFSQTLKETFELLWIDMPEKM